MEPLEFGELLMRRRPRLEAFAAWLADDRQRVGAAIRKSLADTWRARDRLASEIEMDRFLYAHLRSALRIQDTSGTMNAAYGQALDPAQCRRA